jgi:hypothetical protein
MVQPEIASEAAPAAEAPRKARRFRRVEWREFAGIGLWVPYMRNTEEQHWLYAPECERIGDAEVGQSAANL